jgi:tRNA-dihydrouridine synthase B
VVPQVLGEPALYGEDTGVRTARKHIGWAVHALPGGQAFRALMNTHDDCATQLACVTDYLEQLADRYEHWPAANNDLLRQEA